jgi:hypothetical protein
MVQRFNPAIVQSDLAERLICLGDFEKFQPLFERFQFHIESKIGEPCAGSASGCRSTIIQPIVDARLGFLKQPKIIRSEEV